MRHLKLKRDLIALAALSASTAQAQSAVGDESCHKLIDMSTKDMKSENDDALTLANAGHTTKPGNDEYMKPIVTREMLAGTQKTTPDYIKKISGRNDLSPVSLDSFTKQHPAQFGAKHHMTGAHAAFA